MIEEDKEFPSLDSAYGYSLSAYGWVISRVSAVEKRFDSLLALAAATMIGIPVAVSALHSGTIPWTILSLMPAVGAICVFGAILYLAFYARRRIAITTVDTNSFVSKDDPWIKRSTPDFTGAVLRGVVTDLNNLKSRVDEAAKLADMIALLLISQVILGGTWAGVSLTL